MLQKVNVNGYTRIAVNCVEDVPPGGFLSYDYQFDTDHPDKFTCICGSKKCRGTMKGGKQKKEEEKLNRKDTLKKAKNRLVKDTEYIEKVEAEAAERLDLVKLSVPGAGGFSENVLNGPSQKYKAVIRDTGVCLWRNVLRGGDVATKIQRMTRKREMLA